jgi:Lrp/AsnC family transcriptional regulator, leucine-responsive regulatory protein
MMNPRAKLAIRRATSRSLDRVDKQILKHLQSDGRKTVAALAREVSLGYSACIDRVRSLEKDGFIQGYAALLNPDCLGARLLAFVGIRVDRTTPHVLHGFRAAIGKLEEVVECHRVAGGFDYVVKIRVPDMESYNQFLNDRLAALPGVAHTHTFMAMEEVKSTLRFKF